MRPVLENRILILATKAKNSEVDRDELINIALHNDSVKARRLAKALIEDQVHDYFDSSPDQPTDPDYIEDYMKAKVV